MVDKPFIQHIDQNHIWHPFTQAATASQPLAIKRAEGAYYYDYEDKPYLDLIASWWVNIHGHGHPQLVKALYDQAKALDHILFAGFTHLPAAQLTKTLLDIAGAPFSRVFFSDNGSTAIEVALKMAYQYWQNLGQKRMRFLGLQHAYHGDTWGAMMVGQTSNFFHAYQPFPLMVDTLPVPEYFHDCKDIEIKEAQALDQLETLLKTHGHDYAAFIVEPLMLGAGGMKHYRTTFLAQVIACVRAYGILVIFDEIMTGFGRLGTYFAFQQLHQQYQPDIICCSKGLTGGLIPLAVTLTHETLFQAFWHNEFSKTFIHGHSYTANPIACHLAVTSLTLLAAGIPNFAPLYKRLFMPLYEENLISKLRIIGNIVAFDINLPDNNYGTHYSQTLRHRFLESGLILRPLGNTIYLMPPYVITEEQLTSAATTIKKILCNI